MCVSVDINICIQFDRTYNIGQYNKPINRRFNKRSCVWLPIDLTVHRWGPTDAQQQRVWGLLGWAVWGKVGKWKLCGGRATGPLWTGRGRTLRMGTPIVDNWSSSSYNATVAMLPPATLRICKCDSTLMKVTWHLDGLSRRTCGCQENRRIDMQIYSRMSLDLSDPDHTSSYFV